MIISSAGKTGSGYSSLNLPGLFSCIHTTGLLVTGWCNRGVKVLGVSVFVTPAGSPGRFRLQTFSSDGGVCWSSWTVPVCWGSASTSAEHEKVKFGGRSRLSDRISAVFSFSCLRWYLCAVGGSASFTVDSTELRTPICTRHNDEQFSGWLYGFLNRYRVKTELEFSSVTDGLIRVEC